MDDGWNAGRVQQLYLRPAWRSSGVPGAGVIDAWRSESGFEVEYMAALGHAGPFP